MIDFSLVSDIKNSENIISVIESSKSKDFTLPKIVKILRVRIPLRIVGGKISNFLIPIANFLVTALLILLQKPRIPLLEHHGIILIAENDVDSSKNYWTAQKYQCGCKGPIRLYKFESLEKAIIEIKDCGCNPPATHQIEEFLPNGKAHFDQTLNFMKNYDQTYSYITPMHCQTFASAFLKEFTETVYRIS